MVDYGLESHPRRGIKKQWKYYLEEAKQEPEVRKQLEDLKSQRVNPREIKALDPGCGSGHILVYAFDVLYGIYISDGYMENIPQLILENNLYGLDIDDRAAQLASFALMMKGRSKSRGVFRKKIKLNICAIQESNDIPTEAIDNFGNVEGLENEKTVLKANVDYLINVFHNAKEYGSILNVEAINFEVIKEWIEQLHMQVMDLFASNYKEILLEKLPRLVKQAMIMGQKYDVVITNPPYMGRNGMNSNLMHFTEKNYPNSKGDLFAVFIEKALLFTDIKKYVSLITMQSWVYLPLYEDLEKNFLNLID